MAVLQIRKVAASNLITIAGDYTFAIKSAKPSNSFLKPNGERKDYAGFAPEYENPTKEILFVLEDVEGTGIFFHSHSTQVFVKMKNLSAADVKAYKKQGIVKESTRDGYLLLSTDKGKTFNRIEAEESKEKDDQIEIFSKLAFACGHDEESIIDDEDATSLKEAFEGRYFGGKLLHKDGVSNEGEEKQYLKLGTSFKKVSESDIDAIKSLSSEFE